MKKSNIFIAAIFSAACCALSSACFSQATIQSNMRPGTGFFLGWDNSGVPGSLEIRNDFNQPINIYTSGSQRMSIRPNGRVGICSANRLSSRI